MKNKKTILLTGATGFLGSNLLRAFVNVDNFKVIILKRRSSNISRIKDLINNGKLISYDLEDYENSNVIKKDELDIIVHCATNYGRNKDDLINVIKSNVLLPLNILQEIIINNKGKSCTFINVDTILSKKVNAYSMSKNHFLDWLKYISDNFPKINCLNVRLSNFYGAGDNDNKFTTAVIRSFLKNDLNLDLTFGEQKRRFIYIDDVVTAFLKIVNNLDNIKDFEIDISVAEKTKIKDFVLQVKALTGNSATKLNFGAIPYRSNEDMDTVSNLELITSIGWKPKFSLSEGLHLTIQQERKLL